MNFSEPTGTMDENTRSRIKDFQVYLRKVKDTSISVDGRLDPAKGTKCLRQKRTLDNSPAKRVALEMFLLNLSNTKAIFTKFAEDFRKSRMQSANCRLDHSI